MATSWIEKLFSGKTSADFLKTRDAALERIRSQEIEARKLAGQARDAEEAQKRIAKAEYLANLEPRRELALAEADTYCREKCGELYARFLQNLDKGHKSAEVSVEFPRIDTDLLEYFYEYDPHTHPHPLTTKKRKIKGSSAGFYEITSTIYDYAHTKETQIRTEILKNLPSFLEFKSACSDKGLKFELMYRDSTPYFFDGDKTEGSPTYDHPRFGILYHAYEKATIRRSLIFSLSV